MPILLFPSLVSELGAGTTYSESMALTCTGVLGVSAARASIGTVSLPATPQVGISTVLIGNGSLVLSAQSNLSVLARADLRTAFSLSGVSVFGATGGFVMIAGIGLASSPDFQAVSSNRYDVALALSVHGDAVISAMNRAQAGIALNTAPGLASSGLLIMVHSVGMAATPAIGISGVFSLAGGVSLSVLCDMAVQSRAIVVGPVGLQVAPVVVLGSRAAMISGLPLSSSPIDLWTSKTTMLGSFGLSTSAGLQPASALTIRQALAIGVQAGLLTETSAQLLAGLAMQSDAGMDVAALAVLDCAFALSVQGRLDLLNRLIVLIRGRVRFGTLAMNSSGVLCAPVSASRLDCSAVDVSGLVGPRVAGTHVTYDFRQSVLSNVEVV